MEARHQSLGGINLYNGKMTRSTLENCTDCYNLVLVSAGAGELFAEGATYPVCEGSLLLIKPMTYYRITSPDTLKYTGLSFSDRAMSDMAKSIAELITEDASYGFIYQGAENIPYLSSTMRAMSNAQKLPADCGEEYARGILHALLAIISSASGEHLCSVGDDLGAKIRAYLNENVTAEVTLESLERVFFVSKYYLCRAFNRYSGTSIHSYLTRKRIALAAKLIESGESASSVAYKVGFGDYSAFYRAYVKYRGTSPTGNW